MLLELMVSGSVDEKYALAMQTTISATLTSAEVPHTSPTPLTLHGEDDESTVLARAAREWRKQEARRSLNKPQAGFSQISILAPGNYVHLQECKSKTQVHHQSLSFVLSLLIVFFVSLFCVV